MFYFFCYNHSLIKPIANAIKNVRFLRAKTEQNIFNYIEFNSIIDATASV